MSLPKAFETLLGQGLGRRALRVLSLGSEVGVVQPGVVWRQLQRVQELLGLETYLREDFVDGWRYCGCSELWLWGQVLLDDAALAHAVESPLPKGGASAL